MFFWFQTIVFLQMLAVTSQSTVLGTLYMLSSWGREIISTGFFTFFPQDTLDVLHLETYKG